MLNIRIISEHYMKKQDLVDVVMQAGNVEVKKNAAAIVDAIFDSITKAMAKGDEAAIAGFGTFKIVKRAARMGVNPKTGEKIQIAASTKPKFRAAKALKEAVK